MGEIVCKNGKVGSIETFEGKTKPAPWWQPVDCCVVGYMRELNFLKINSIRASCRLNIHELPIMDNFPIRIIICPFHIKHRETILPILIILLIRIRACLRHLMSGEPPAIPCTRKSWKRDGVRKSRVLCSIMAVMRSMRAPY